ncbi:unnamed protein product [Ceratitis capitata]|uniref:(Mediterranean fruit fly) hypothetical protein n=1 Tax=Ceratitis capitata TaxID=7213 RepID=A0A811U3R6_CERCA|nr:unnamed protein product [Ceratitis capitata]
MYFSREESGSTAHSSRAINMLVLLFFLASIAVASSTFLHTKHKTAANELNVKFTKHFSWNKIIKISNSNEADSIGIGVAYAVLAV